MNDLILSKEALLAKPALKTEEVRISKGIIFVREMTGYEKDAWENSIMKTAPNGNMTATPKLTYDLTNYRAKLAVSTICDADGTLLFSMKDIELLTKALSATDLEKIVDAAQKINAVSDKDKEDMLKNSEADHEDSSTSESAENLE